MFVLLAFVGGGTAHANVVTACYADAEGDNPGATVTVKVSGVTKYSGGDLDSAFEEVARYHTNAGIAVTYNSDGRAALRHAMDCMFDNGHVTLSSAWIQANISDLEVRNYGVRVFDGATPVWSGEFNEVDVVGTVSHIRFNGYAIGDCLTVEAAALGTYDLMADFTVTSLVKLCTADDCSKCRKGGAGCTCKTGDGACGYNPIAGTVVSNGGIIKVAIQ